MAMAMGFIWLSANLARVPGLLDAKKTDGGAI
jgi:hypothetical protein